MMSSNPENALEYYSETCRPIKVLELDNFSGWGGRVNYRVAAEEGSEFCLRRWPKGQPSRQHLEFIQAVLWASDCEGVNWLPLPFETNEGKGYVELDGFIWELLPWFAGYKIPFDEPILPGQLFSLVELLAEFHRAVENFPFPAPAKSVSPRVIECNRQWRYWVREKFSRLNTALSSSIFLHVEPLPIYSGFRTTEVEAIRDEMIELAKLLMRAAMDRAGRLISILSRSSRIAVSHLPVLQSLYRRHLIFSETHQVGCTGGPHLVGLADCSEMGIDTPAVDMAMILTHLAPWESAESIQALAHYRKIRDIPDSEYYLMITLYHAETVLYPLNKLAKLFLPNEPGYLSAPNIAQIAAVRDELRWGLGQIANFKKDEKM